MDKKQECKVQGRSIALCAQCGIMPINHKIGTQHCIEPTDPNVKAANSFFPDYDIKDSKQHKRKYDESAERSPMHTKRLRAKLNQHMHQEFEPPLNIPYSNYSYRFFHDRLNQSCNYLSKALEQMKKKDDYVRAYDLTTDDFSVVETRKRLAEIETLVSQLDAEIPPLRRKVKQMQKKLHKEDERLKAARRERNIKVLKLQSLIAEWERKMKYYFETPGPFEQRWNQFCTNNGIRLSMKMIKGKEAFAFFDAYEEFAQLWSPIEFKTQDNKKITIGSERYVKIVRKFFRRIWEMNQIVGPVTFRKFKKIISILRSKFSGLLSDQNKLH